MANQTVFNAAIPYAVGTIALGAAGAALILTAQTTAATVVGVALAILSTYMLMGIFFGGILANDTESFKRDIGKTLLTSGAAALQSLIKAIADAAIRGLQQGISQRVADAFSPARR